MRLAIAAVMVMLCLGCGDGSSSSAGIAALADIGPSETSTPGPSVEPSATTPAATLTPEPATATPKPTPTERVVPSVEPTSSATATPTPVASRTPVPSPTASTTATPSPSPSPTVVAPGTGTQPQPDKTLPPSTYDGAVKAVRTASGVVMAVRDVTAQGYEVVTPCYNVATLAAGTEITGPIDVLIDPGHGGDETGAVGPNGLKESTINLRVADLLRAELTDRGYRVLMTRYADHRVAIQSRTELANAVAPRIFVSIHHNGGYPEPMPQAGTEVFVQQGDGEGARLGGIIFEEIQSAFAGIDIDWVGNPESFGVAWRANRSGGDLYGVLRRTPQLVSVLSEAMFLNSPAEAALLAKPETAVREARALADAIDRYFTTDDPGSGFTAGVVFQGDLGNGGGTEGCVDPAF